MQGKHSDSGCLLANYFGTILRAISVWKGTDCSDYLVKLLLFLEGLLFSHYSCHLLSCHLLACACVVAVTESHGINVCFRLNDSYKLSCVVDYTIDVFPALTSVLSRFSNGPHVQDEHNWKLYMCNLSILAAENIK